jgi:hypothetical protein
MTFLVKAIFEDGSSKFVSYSDSYDEAIACLFHLADQRTTYASLLPLLQNVQLLSGDRIDFDMRVERRDIGQFQRTPTGKSDLSVCPELSSHHGLLNARSKGRPLSPANLVQMSSYRRPFNELDMLTHWRPLRPHDAGFHSGLDNVAHTIRVMGSGIWREQHAARYFDQQKRIVDQARRQFGSLKVLFDVRNWVVENPESSIQFQNVNRELYHPDDRLAAVVRCENDKSHPRTALQGKNTEVFTSLSDAEAWLQCTATVG